MVKCTIIILYNILGAYYVGFDFEATGQNPNQQVAADGYYSDWIVKISPAVYTNAYRIIAEDLGDSDDFDFNDVVFDVATNGEQLSLPCRLRVVLCLCILR